MYFKWSLVGLTEGKASFILSPWNSPLTPTWIKLLNPIILSIACLSHYHAVLWLPQFPQAHYQWVPICSPPCCTRQSQDGLLYQTCCIYHSNCWLGLFCSSHSLPLIPRTQKAFCLLFPVHSAFRHRVSLRRICWTLSAYQTNTRTAPVTKSSASRGRNVSTEPVSANSLTCAQSRASQCVPLTEGTTPATATRRVLNVSNQQQSFHTMEPAQRKVGQVCVWPSFSNRRAMVMLYFLPHTQMLLLWNVLMTT